jgi:hypothetical protein
MIEIHELGFERVKENEIMMPHPLKENLGVGCVRTTKSRVNLYRLFYVCMLQWHGRL